MRLEHIPILVGVLFALLGAALVADALMPDGAFVAVERRRRRRAERSTRGELLVGVGVIALAAALIGRDGWDYGTVAVLVGMVLVTGGALMNLPYLRELFTNRGALRRTQEGAPPSADRGDRRIR